MGDRRRSTDQTNMSTPFTCTKALACILSEVGSQLYVIFIKQTKKNDNYKPNSKHT